MKINMEFAAYKHLLLAVLAIGFVGCATNDPKSDAPAKPKPTVDIEKQKEDIKTALVNIWDAIEKVDIERYATYIHDDFTQFGETAKVLRVGKAAQVKAIKDWVEEPTKVHTEMKDAKLTNAKIDIAIKIHQLARARGITTRDLLAFMLGIERLNLKLPALLKILKEFQAA